MSGYLISNVQNDPFIFSIVKILMCLLSMFFIYFYSRINFNHWRKPAAREVNQWLFKASPIHPGYQMRAGCKKHSYGIK